ncbi:glucose 1-dehydrogenase [Soonwooa sp.]|uniref:glucose 1-dehydrogenase n=1 Tax=Soonwooa sp. TaxID=1938592 RepID=UPI00262515B8|nr:glucose 1-dehydrogenase [Soonwooa sp.]
MEINLNGQVAIITGSSSGIGEGIARSLAASGAIVIINHSSEHSKDAAQIILDEILLLGGRGMLVQCDVSSEEEVQAMFQKTIETYGTVDILVNNAGLQQDAKFVDMTLAQWQKVIDVNLTGQFLCAREAIREFLRRGMNDKSISLGKIINISSVHESIPWAGHANYASSKGALRMLMQTLAQEYGKDKIRINNICPGAIQTPINKSAWDNEASFKALMTLIPYNRIGKAEDIGNLAVFLASDFSDYITGASIYIDGGMSSLESFADNG